MKTQVLDLIRQSHVRLARRALPDRLAVYFHALERSDLPAFTEAMAWFRDHGYRFADPQSYAVDGGPGDKRLFVSFDDNFRNWHDALDALSRCGARVTFYTNSGCFRDQASAATISDYFDRIAYFGDRQTLSRSELRDIAAAGHTIGCHTHTHPVLSRTPPTAWYDEILASKALLEKITGQCVEDFSFPFGMRRHFTEALRLYCASHGFRTIATGISGQLHAERIDPLQIHRTGWKFDLSLEDNLDNLRVDGRLYARLSGRSAIG